MAVHTATHLDTGFPVSYTSLEELPVTVPAPFRITSDRARPCVVSTSNPRELARQLAFTRREFLCSAGRVALGSALLPTSSRAFGATPLAKRKVIVITFGGGARDQETFAPEGQENIPHLMRELIPQSAFFTNVSNRGILGHYVATASLATGVYETINNFASLPPESPTVFEYFRKELKRPASDAWVVAPSNGFNRIGESSHRSFGPGWGAQVILPKYLLSAATSGQGDYGHLLRDSYETPLYAPELGGNIFELEQLETILKLSVADFKAHARTLSSPDELSVYIVRQLMRQFAPSLLWVTLHDIDIAHGGRIACRRNSGRPSRANRNMRARPRSSYFQTSGVIPTKTPAAMVFSITGQGMRFPEPPG